MRSSISEQLFTVGDLRPSCDANEVQEAEQGTRHGGFTSETPEHRERGLQKTAEPKEQKIVLNK